MERFAALREEVGSEVDLALDFHGRFSPTMSRRLIKELEPFYPYFVEEPCLPGNIGSAGGIEELNDGSFGRGTHLHQVGIPGFN